MSDLPFHNSGIGLMAKQRAHNAALAECHDKMEEMGNTIESLRAELAAERAANARLQELHTGLMKNADSMNDELRAANAKHLKDREGNLILFPGGANLLIVGSDWAELVSMYGDSHTRYLDKFELSFVHAALSAGEAVPVQQD